jgi:RNA polymerase sigma-70 factor (ECF subfamily)
LSKRLADRQQKVLQLLDASGARLHALLGRLTLCEDAVGDLMQELFIRLYQSRGFEKARDPLAYAYRTAINLAFEWRRSRKINFRSLDEGCVPAGGCASALGTMIRTEELEQLLDATSKLSGLARDVVVMHYIEQQPYEEIGRRLGKKPQHLRSVAAKAVAKLRQLLAVEPATSD